MVFGIPVFLPEQIEVKNCDKKGGMFLIFTSWPAVGSPQQRHAVDAISTSTGGSRPGCI